MEALPDFRARVRQLTSDDSEWPTALGDLADTPQRLFLAGKIPQPGPRVAIVGTRKPCGFGRSFARELGCALAGAGWLVISGGAEGIDCEAHAGALQALAPTLAVLGSSIEEPFPTKNIELFQKIALHGGLLSELPRAGAVYRSRFLARNRLIAAIADVVVVVQAPRRSGAMSTAAWATKLGRPLLAVPHAPWDPRGEGCLALLAGSAKICRSAADVLSLAAPKPGDPPARRAGATKKRKRIQGLDDDEQALVTALRRGPATLDELCELTALTAPRVHRATLMLMLSKVIQEVGGGRYGCADRA